MTFSMCAVRSASRCSMWAVSVQMRLVTSRSSWSARSMKAAKFWPRPTGSRMVKRTLPGGTHVRSRYSTACSASTALARPASCAKNSIDARSGKGHAAGSVKSSTASIRGGEAASPLPSSSGTRSGICSFPTLISPNCSAGGAAAAGGRSAQHGSDQAGKSRTHSVRTASTPERSSATARRHSSAINCQPRSKPPSISSSRLRRFAVSSSTSASWTRCASVSRRSCSRSSARRSASSRRSAPCLRADMPPAPPARRRRAASWPPSIPAAPASARVSRRAGAAS